MVAASANGEMIEPSPSPTKSPSIRSSDVATSESPSTNSRPDPPSDYSNNSTPSPSRQVEIQPSLRSEEYRQLFRLPPGEVLIQDFNCALQENFLLQGHMYLFVHYICFYSNLFGFETKKVIPFQDVTSVKRAKTAGIFPTAIELVAAGKKFFFSSFLSRDEALKLINDGWLEHGNGAQAISEQQDSKPELNGQEPGIAGLERLNGTKQIVGDPEVINSKTDDLVPEDSEASPSGQAEVSLASSRVEDIEEDDAVLVQNDDFLSSMKSPIREMEETDAPDVPEDYTLAAESEFPIKVEEFFNLFFSDDAIHFLESFRKKCRDKDLKSTSWKAHGEFSHAREVSFQHPIKIYLGAKFGSCKELQTYQIYRNSHLVLKTSQEINDVPYGDYFTVEGLWDVKRDGDGCKLRVYVYVAFSKKTMWKGKIVQATLEECRDAYASWIELAHEYLKQKNIEKEVNLISDTQVHKEAEEVTEECLEQPHAEVDMTLSQTLSDSNNIGQVSPSLQENPRGGSVASFIRESIMKSVSSLKSQCKVPSFVVIILALVILLMQISIVVLLLKPQSIQVISESDWMRNIHSERRVQTLSLLDKQINHLKEEMLIVETLLEKMRHEHEMLTLQLKNLMLLQK